MIPNLWRCGPSPLLDVVGALLHPVSLLVLLGFWSAISLVGSWRVAAVVGRLLFALTAQSVALATILFGVTLTLGQLINPTRMIEALQLIGGALSWISALAILRGRRLPRWLVRPGAPTVEGARRPVALALGAAVVSALWLCIFFRPPIRALYLLAIPVWFFDLATTRVASDACLAVRVLERGPASGPNPPPPPSPAPYSGDVCCLSFPDPASDAVRVLIKRGPSAAPAAAWVVGQVLARDNRAAQEKAFPLVRELARWTGGHPLLEAWADSAKHPPGQQLVRNWLVCASLHRRDRMGRDVDHDCMYPPRRK